MLKKISSLLVIALLLTAVPAGAALASPHGEEQIVKQEVIMGYFDVWKGSKWQDTNNDGNLDKPGQTGKITKPFSYSAAEKLDKYQLTRVEVKYPFTPEEYVAAGGRQYGPDGKPANMTWDRFRKDYLNYLPQNLSVQIAGQDLAAGKATVKWGLDLIELNQGGILDLKDPENRQFIGYQPKNFDSLIEGWRWYLPGIITWYGVPIIQETPVVNSSEPYSIDGCFWDFPRREGDKFYTYIIRAPRAYKAPNPATLYDIKSPIKANIIVYEANSEKVILDEKVTFTKDNPVWVKKITFSAPPEGSFAGIRVATFSDGVKWGTTVRNGVSNVGGEYLPSSHTTSGDKGFTSWLPWELIKKRYGLSPLYE